MARRKRSRAQIVGPALLLLLTSFSSSLKAATVKTARQVKAISRTAFNPQIADTLMPVKLALTTETSYLSAHLKRALPVSLNVQVAGFVSAYLQKNRDALQKIKLRSQPYFKIIDAVFSQHGLPSQLKYLAVVESELKRTVVSPVGAAGPWQLMPTTARELGLKVSSKQDERKHYYKSTRAAAMYLKKLYAAFDDWLLVIAAYNSGPGTVYKAMRQAGSRNFWKLQSFLPAETKAHVKRFISTHYYFEANGSETTLTKAEFLAYNKSAAAQAARQPIQFVWNKTVFMADGELVVDNSAAANMQHIPLSEK